MGSGLARAAIPVEAVPNAPPQEIHRFIKGLDTGVARVMSQDEVATELNDPFAVLLLRRGVFPTTVHEVLDAIDTAVTTDSPLRIQASFLVGEGSQLPLSAQTANLARGLRLAVTRGRQNEIDILVSTSATGDLADRFLQVIGWDDAKGVFHFYEHRDGTWIWAGNSFHALDAPSRGEGPFDSHVNGSMVMKELKFPWTHWQSVAATVPPEVFAPDDPARNDPLFTKVSGAEFFEAAVVVPGVRRWTNRRLATTTKPDGTVEKVPQLLRQLFETTTVNLVSAPEQSRAITPSTDVHLPPTFFIDADTLIETLKLPAPPSLTVSGQVYLGALESFGVALVDGAFRQPGDTHFAFFVPERALEDIDVVRKCLEIGLVSERFVACVLMIDVSNPIFSTARAALLQYVPDTGKIVAGSSPLADEIALRIETASAPTSEGSPERAFVANWQLGDGWRAAFEQRLTAYYGALTNRLATADGFADVFRLAESRRRQVRELELSEGRPLLFASTNVDPDAPSLQMLPDATVVPIPTAKEDR
jgi:hypothetical protein